MGYTKPETYTEWKDLNHTELTNSFIDARSDEFEEHCEQSFIEQSSNYTALPRPPKTEAL